MVMRYWGTSAVYAETFADLVDADAKGIRGRELIRALEGRGYAAVAIEGDASRVQGLLAKRRPVIALIEDRPGRFHYVVIVGWRGNRVIVHDPARSPFRVLEAEAFTRAWSASRFWTLVAEPRTAVTSTCRGGFVNERTVGRCGCTSRKSGLHRPGGGGHPHGGLGSRRRPAHPRNRHYRVSAGSSAVAGAGRGEGAALRLARGGARCGSGPRAGSHR